MRYFPAMLERTPRLVVSLKNELLPSQPAIRRLPCGIGRGLRLQIDFEHQTKLYLGLYEVELNRFIREVCFPNADCFDVGGHAGYDALVLAKMSGGRVRSFECDHDAVRRMRKTFEANPTLRGRIDTLEVTVADRTDRAAGHLCLDDAAFGPGGFVPGVIKIDIDGAEAEALAGAKRLLRERRPHVIVETHSRELEATCGKVLRDAGYRPTVVNQRSWLRDQRPIPHNRWLVARGVTPQAGL
jgi:hypothetical protein